MTFKPPHSSAIILINSRHRFLLGFSPPEFLEFHHSHLGSAKEGLHLADPLGESACLLLVHLPSSLLNKEPRDCM